MNNYLLILVFTIISLNELKAQNTLDLYSLPGLSIASNTSDDTGQIFRSTRFYVKDTLIDGISYLEYQNKNCNSYFLRIDEHKVFIKNSNGNEDETLIHDFGLMLGDTIGLTVFIQPSGPMDIDFILTSKDLVTFLDGRERIRIRLSPIAWNGELIWVEGVGNFNFSNNIECIKDENGSIYMNIPEEECNKLMCKNISIDFDYEANDNSVTLINQSKNFEELEWNMGDGSIYTDDVVNHEYSMEGCYEITLEVKNSCGDIKRKSIPFSYCVDSLWVAQSDVYFKEISMIDELNGFGITENELFKTENSGTTWNAVGLEFNNDTIQYNFYDLKMKGDFGAIVIENSNIESDLFFTEDKGINWKELIIPELISKWRPSISVDVDGNILLLSGSRVFSSIDRGETWEKTATEGGNTPFAGSLYQGEEGLCVVTQLEQTDITRSIINVSYDYGRSFIHTVIDDNSTMFGITFIEDTGYITTDTGILKTEDLGLTWFEVTSFQEFLNFRDIYFSDPENGILISFRNIYRTNNGGIDWNIEYCQNQFGLQKLEIIDSIELIKHISGIIKYQPEEDFDCNTTKNDNNTLSGISIFPNPSNNVIYIDKGNRKIKSIRLFSIQGKEIQMEQSTIGQGRIDISKLSSGIYVLRFETDQNLFVNKKFIKT